MNDYTMIVNAIDRLAEKVGQTNVVAECLSTVLATVGSVVAVLVFEVIKNNVFTPRTEFRKMQRNVNGSLALYAHYYDNPIDYKRPMMNERTVEDYIGAAAEVRRLAVEVVAFADERKCKKCCGVKVTDIRKAGNLLIGLSNSFFSPDANLERDYTRKRVKDIKQLLCI